MKFYNRTRFIFPRNYSMRIFAICFGTVHLPIIAFGLTEALVGDWDWAMFLPLLAATLLGTVIAVCGLHGLLSPIRIATENLRFVQEGKRIEIIPRGGADLAGELLNAVALAAQSTAAKIDRLRGAAGTDALTGLHNRRGFKDTLREALQPGIEGALVLLDGDRFKQVNDLYGHGEGDRLLKTFARRIRDAVRADDVAGRWGGDEFIIFFPGLSDAEASEVVEAIRGTLIQRPAVLLDNRPVTFTYGLAQLGGSGRVAFDDALAAADRMLYRRKETRRAPADALQVPSFLGGTVATA